MRTGKRPIVFTWPYGAYNSIGIEEAKKHGFEMLLTLNDGYSRIGRLDRVNRYYLEARLDWLKAFKESRWPAACWRITASGACRSIST